VATGLLVGYALLATGAAWKLGSAFLAAFTAAATVLYWLYQRTSNRPELPLNPYRPRR
jgi:uncharacterized membrane protein YphA (DoxX/SURF4 family)